MCRQLRIQLGISRLIPYQRWVTPIVEPRRFDARFYIVKLTEAEAERLGVLEHIDNPNIDHPDATTGSHHDGHETVASAWYRPEAALAMYEAEKLDLMLPQWFLLRTMCGVPFAQLDAFRDTAASRFYSPDIYLLKEKGQLVALLDGDYLHSKSISPDQLQHVKKALLNENGSGPMHRVYFELQGLLARVAEYIQQPAKSKL
jgi:hypothetical protein